MRYTFDGLSPADFEELCADLLGAEFGVRIQTFTNGRDGGVDLRVTAKGEIWVGQCKRVNGTFANLERAFRNVEKPKVKKLAPDRYLICTSLGLTPANKERLAAIMAPWCTGPDDVFGRQDLNALLLRHSEVERRHHKLWLTSVAVLERILRGGSEAWVAMERDEIERTLRIYVQTGAFDEAREVLGEHHACVVSGIPGIGKTTLAQVLIAHFIELGYELVVAREDVREALEQLDRTKQRKQIVYYDDFLGQSSFKLGKNEDNALVRLLELSSRSGGRIKTILTTREYILQEARQKIERLRRAESIDVSKVIVDIGTYTRGKRARILYNHLFFSPLEPQLLMALVESGRYKEIVDHKNFNPRLVEWMTFGMGASGVAPDGFAETFLANLENPVEIWGVSFDEQLGEDARRLLFVLATFPRPVLLGALEEAWAAASEGTPSAAEARRRFLKTLRTLEGSFIRHQLGLGTTIVEFHNPSVRDFVVSRIIADKAHAHELLETAVWFEQVDCLVCMRERKAGYTPSGLIPAGEALAHAIERTAPVGLPENFSYRALGLQERFGHGDRTSVKSAPTAFLSWGEQWSRHSPTAGERMANCVDWAHELQSEEVLLGAFAATRTLLCRKQFFGEGTTSVVRVAEAWRNSVAGRKRDPNLGAELMAATKTSLTDGDASLSDWRQWASALDSDVGRELACTSLADWKAVLLEVLTEEADYAADSPGDVDLDEKCEEIESLGALYHLDVSSLIDRVRQAQVELEDSREPQYDRPDWRPASSAATSDDDADEAIDRLFASLIEIVAPEAPDSAS